MILFDEPTSALAPISAQQIEALIADLQYGAGAALRRQSRVSYLDDLDEIIEAGATSLPVLLGPDRAAQVARPVKAAPQVVVIALLLSWGRFVEAGVVVLLLIGQLMMMRRFSRAPVCSGCFRLEPLPRGTCTHWKAPPSHGARPKRPFALRENERPCGTRPFGSSKAD